MIASIYKFVSDYWKYAITLFSTISGLGVYKMIINHKVKKISEQYLNHIVQVVIEHENNNPNNTDKTYDVYAGEVERDFPLEWYYKVYFLLDTSKFYKRVLLRLKEQGNLDKIDESHFTFSLGKNVNKKLFEILPATENKI